MNYRRNKSEASFTLLETIIAIAILTTVILELVNSQGNMVYFANYTRRLNEATFLAKRMMSQVEYHWANKEFKDVKADLTEQEFKDVESGFEYTYSLSIKDWKFPFLQFITGGGAEGEEEGESSEDPMGGMIEDMLTKVLGKEILKIAHVEVFWPEGAKRNSVTLTLLLTNQRKVDEEILKLAPSWDKFQKELNKKPNPKPDDKPSENPE